MKGIVMFRALGTFGAALVVLTAAAMTGSAQTDRPLSLRELRELWTDAYQQRDYARAIRIGLQITSGDEHLETDQYNLACVYALSGDGAKAVEWLRRCAHSGFDQADLVKTDPDLASIRSDPGYRDALAAIQGNLDRARKDFARRAAKSKPRVVLPPDRDASRPAPLIIVLHGYGGNAEGMVHVWKETAAEFGAVLVVPRAVRLTGFGGFDWRTVDEADILVTRALEQATRDHHIDPDRIILSGFSQGGYMAYALGFRHAERFCGVIPVAGHFPMRIMDTIDTPPKRMPKFFIMIGSGDPAVGTNRRGAQELERRGVSVKLNVYEGVGHFFPKDYPVELRKALRYILSP